MPTRFKLPGSGTAGLAPALRYAWTHVQASPVTRPMATANSGTAFVSTSYSPDSADHLVAGAAHFATFVSPSLTAQTIPAQTVAISVLCNQVNASNAQVVTWHLYAVTGADALVGTLVNGRLDATVCTTGINYRTDSTTSTSVTVGSGDRLVLEIGLSGTPVAGGGTQGHNGVMRFGDNLGTDIPASDTGNTDAVPWIELATTTLAFQGPSTTGAASLRARGTAVAPTAKGGSTTTALRARGAAVATVAKAAATTTALLARGAVAATSGAPKAGTAGFTRTSGVSLTPTLPSGWQAGDIHVLLVSVNDNAATLATPAGWTAFATGGLFGTGHRAWVFWRRAQLGDTAPTLALGDNAVTTPRGARIYGVPGATPTDPVIDVSSALGGAPTATAFTFIDVTTTDLDEPVLALVAYAENPTAVSTMAGWTQQAGALATFGPDPLVDATTTVVDDPLVVGDAAAAPGVALLHEHRRVATPAAAGATTVSITTPGSIAPAPWASFVVAFKTVTLVVTTGTARPQTSGSLSAQATRAATATIAARASAQGTATGVRGGVAIAQPLVRARQATTATRLGAAVAGARMGTRATIGATRTTAATTAPRARTLATTTAQVQSPRAAAFRARTNAQVVARHASSAAIPLANAARIAAAATPAHRATTAPRAAAGILAISIVRFGVVALAGRARPIVTPGPPARIAAVAQRASATLGAPGLRGGLAAPAASASVAATTIVTGFRSGAARWDGDAELAFVGLHGGRIRAGVLRGEVAGLGIGLVGHRAPAALRARARAESAWSKRLSPGIPLEQWVPLDLGTGYRGDTIVLPVWSAVDRQGNPFDLDNSTIWFTAKVDLVLSDAAPTVIQCSTRDGGVALVGPPGSGLYRVTIGAYETQALDGDAVFVFDVQLSTGDPAGVYTIKRGLLTVVRDVTRTPA